MATYLLEIGTEEIPARFVPAFLEKLKTSVSDILLKNRVSFDLISAYATYRRLTLLISNIEPKQSDATMIIKGPPLKISKDAAGNFLPPAIGFAKKNKVDVSDLTEMENNGEMYLSAKQFEKGGALSEFMPEFIASVVKSLPLPIAMKWGDRQDTFIRPIHWIVSMLDDTHIPLSFYGVTSGCASYGHRFLTTNTNSNELASGERFDINSADSYISQLKSHYVLVDQEARKAKILDTIPACDDECLLEEVVYLTEFPEVVLGEFDKAFLSVPHDALIECMKKNQKYFPITKENTLSNAFYVVAENVTESNRNNIITGNCNVLSARLNDVAFFWEADLKVSLEDNVSKLKKVVYQQALGSVYDKVSRMKVIAKDLIKNTTLEKSSEAILSTIHFSKADLVSLMVYELPKLQGVMGRLYYENQFKNTHDYTEEIALGIEEHYLPRSALDACPTTKTGLIAGLSDRLETIVGCFVIGKLPTGSQDPLGVRRALFGCFKLAALHRFDIDFKAIYSNIVKLLDSDKSIDQMWSFTEQRLKHYFMEAHNMSYDIADSVLFIGMSKIDTAIKNAEHLATLRAEDSNAYKLLTETASRVANLAEKFTGNSETNIHLFETESEKEAYAKLGELDATPHIDDLVKFSLLLTLYFEQTMVMHKDDAIKNNRLSFMQMTLKAFRSVADFKKIVI